MNFLTFASLNMMTAALISTGCKVAIECPIVGAPLVVLGIGGLVANAVQFFSPQSK